MRVIRENRDGSRVGPFRGVEKKPELLSVFRNHIGEANAIANLTITRSHHGDSNQGWIVNSDPHLQGCTHLQGEKAFEIATAQADVASFSAKGNYRGFSQYLNWQA
jgi:hypothetical protein